MRLKEKLLKKILDRPQHKERVFALLEDEIQPITRQTHPRFYEAVEQLCLLNGMVAPPEMYTAKKLRYMTPAGALGGNDMIFFDPAFLDRACDPQTPEKMTEALTIFSHEMGHILGKHTRLDTKRRMIKPQEHEADRTAAQLMGTHEPVIELRQIYSKPGHAYSPSTIAADFLASPNAPKSSFMKEAVRRYANFGDRMLQRISDKNYGTFEEQKANLRSVDLDDPLAREPLAQRIRERNHAITDKRGHAPSPEGALDRIINQTLTVAEQERARVKAKKAQSHTGRLAAQDAASTDATKGRS